MHIIYVIIVIYIYIHHIHIHIHTCYVGISYLTVYRSDYTKGKFVLDQNNLLRICYAHWCSTTNPNFICFAETLRRMLMTSDYVLSAKLLVMNPMDEGRAEACWKVMLKPEVCSQYTVRQIFYGAVTQVDRDTFSPRYNLAHFTAPGDLLERLYNDIVVRRKNTVIVSPPACG